MVIESKLGEKTSKIFRELGTMRCVERERIEMKAEVTKLLNRALGEVIWKIGVESEWDAGGFYDEEVEVIASHVIWGHCGVVG